MDYNFEGLMIIAAAREIQKNERVFIGMRLPLMAFGVAKLCGAEGAVGLFECGLVRESPAATTIHTMGDPPNQKDALWATGTLQVMGLLQAGEVDAGFIGGAEVDRFGNVNSSYIGDFKDPKIKLPGSGGAADIAAMSKRLVVMIRHDPRRLVEKVSYVTSAGGLAGGLDRKEKGLCWGGVAAVVTDKAILRPDEKTKELLLTSIHPGIEIDEVQESTGWDLKCAGKVLKTPPPSKREMEALAQVDKEGFWSS